MSTTAGACNGRRSITIRVKNRFQTMTGARLYIVSFYEHQEFF
jgi:hypothetical protein